MTVRRRILITAGSTREPIDPVRFIGNRSSGKMGVALVAAAIEAGQNVTLIAGPMSAMVTPARRIEIETAAEMQTAVMREFPAHDVLIMAAAVSDFRPVRVSPVKLARADSINIECVPTDDIVAAAGRSKRPDQFIVAFALESEGNIERARAKMFHKNASLMIFNSLKTLGSDRVSATMLSPNQEDLLLPAMEKRLFAARLIQIITKMTSENQPFK